jgi:hypothetical protein
MSKLIQASFSLLQKMYDPKRSLFSYKTDMDAGGRHTNDFSYPFSLRYTINVLTGLQRAREHGRLHWDVDKELDRFLELHGQYIANPGDKGLLLYVAARERSRHHHRIFAEVVGQLDRLRGLNLQEVSWMLSGLTEYAVASQKPEAVKRAEGLFRFIDRHFLNKRTMLPFHSLSLWRKPFTTFGGIVYYLKALAEYAAAFKNKYAEVIFKEGVGKILEFQGPQGEWPWFYNVFESRVVDWYPTFSVHQDSMAMLFLLPALDLGVNGAARAIEKSYRWLFGNNQLGLPMMVNSPSFFIYRCIHRRGSLERPKRFGRSALLSAIGKSARFAAHPHLEVLTHGRSYHLGWILFAWSPRKDFAEFTDLQVLPQWNISAPTTCDSNVSQGSGNSDFPDHLRSAAVKEVC